MGMFSVESSHAAPFHEMLLAGIRRLTGAPGHPIQRDN